MKLYDLAKRVTNFIWDYDPYNARDYYGDDFGKAVFETLRSLNNVTQRQTIYEFLIDLVGEVSDLDAEYAQALAREVAAL